MHPAVFVAASVPAQGEAILPCYASVRPCSSAQTAMMAGLHIAWAGQRLSCCTAKLAWRTSRGRHARKLCVIDLHMQHGQNARVPARLHAKVCFHSIPAGLVTVFHPDCSAAARPAAWSGLQNAQAAQAYRSLMRSACLQHATATPLYCLSPAQLWAQLRRCQAGCSASSCAHERGQACQQDLAS